MGKHCNKIQQLTKNFAVNFKHILKKKIFIKRVSNHIYNRTKKPLQDKNKYENNGESNST